MKTKINLPKRISNRVCIMFFLCLPFIGISAQNLKWGNSIKSDNALTVIDMATDNSGNSYVIGEFMGYASFNANWPGTQYPIDVTASDNTDKDVYVAKYNAQGVCVFATQLGNPTTAGVAYLDLAKAITVSKDGKYIYVSATIAAVNAGDPLIVPGLKDIPLTSLKGSDIVIVRYDQDPADNNFYEPTKAFNIGSDGSFDHASSIAVDNAGDIYLSGVHRGKMSFNPRELPALWGNKPPTGYNVIWMAKYAMSTTKECIWFYDIPNKTNNAFIEGRKILLSGNSIYLAAALRGSANFGGGDLVATAPQTSAMRDIVLAKYTNMGDTISFSWAKVLGKSGQLDNEAKDLAVDAQNRIYIAGNLNGIVNIDGRTDSPLDINGKDAFLARYQSDGTYNYLKTFGGRLDTLNIPKTAGKDEVRGMEIAQNGNIFLCGDFQGININIDPQKSDKAIFTSTLSADGQTYTRDAYVAKYNENGDLIWGNQISGNSDIINAVSKLTSEGDIITAGTFTGNCRLDKNTMLNSTNTTSSSIYIAKYEGASPTALTNNQANRLNVYNDKKNLNIEKELGFDEVKIYSLQGVLVIESIIKNKIDISSLNQGIYIVQLSGKNNTVSVKIQK